MLLPLPGEEPYPHARMVRCRAAWHVNRPALLYRVQVQTPCHIEQAPSSPKPFITK